MALIAVPAGQSPASSGRSNNSFKPNLLRYGNGVAEKACHAVASTAQVGLTQVLDTMRITITVVLSIFCFAFSSASATASERASWRPKIAPEVCARSFCVLYQGHDAITRSVVTKNSSANFPGVRGSISIAVIRLDSGASIAFAGVRSPSICSKSDGSAWVKSGLRSYRALMCVPTAGKDQSLYVGITLIADSPLSADRAALISETCIWPFTYTESLGITGPYCLADGV